jgi:hypothetical protein
MKLDLRNNIWTIPILCSSGHLLLGNFFGYLTSVNLVNFQIIDILFFPYTFIWGMCDFVGWDSFAIFIQIVPLTLVFFLFLPIGLYFYKQNVKA